MTRIVKLALLALVATPCIVSPSRAQASDSLPRINLKIGTPVRAVARDSAHVIVGTFARQAADTLVMHRSLGTNDTTVFLSNLVRIDEQVHPFNTAATRQGAIVGGVVGLVAGILVVRQARNYCENDLVARPEGCENAFLLLPDLVAAGAGIGFGLTWVTEKPRWQVRWSAPLP